MVPIWHRQWRILMSTSTLSVPRQRWAIDPGALQPLVQSYTDHLVARGYRTATIHCLEKRARHFCYWLNRSDIAVTHIDDGVLNRFAAHRCQCPGGRASDILSTAYVGSVRQFVEFLGQSQVVHLPARITGDPRIQAYLDWLRQHLGLSEYTIEARRKLMNQLVPLLGPDPCMYDAAGVRSVIVAESQRRSAVNMKSIVTAARSYLRYLMIHGECLPSLDQAVPSVAHWRHSNLPKYLPAAKVETLINSCDTTTATGIRDRAILLLLARLGLRAGDIMTLRIDDIDWQHGSLRVCGKERREANLPLPQDAGDALLKYLTEARPDVPVAQVFLCSLAPQRPFADSHTVSSIVSRALARAGIDDAPSRGAHLLRHSLATTLLRAGMPLATIGTVLRHRCIDTTAQYAKVDVQALKLIAQPWPGGASC
jgi:site-specific recombinase XerD